MSDPATVLLANFERYSTGDCLGSRPSDSSPFSWSTYSAIRDRVFSLANFFASHVPRDPTDSPVYSVAICSPNREEWLLTDFACALTGFVSVGIHGEWPVSETETVLNEVHAVAAIVDPSYGHVPDDPRSPVLRCLAGVPSLKLIISLDTRLSPDSILFGEALASPPSPPPNLFPECPIFTIIYSSGTTGAPKGLSITKSRWHSDSSNAAFASLGRFTAASHSALAHGMDRGLCWSALYNGGRVALAASDYGPLVRDCQEVEPAVFLSMSGFWVTMFSAFHEDLRRAALEWLEHPRVLAIRERVIAEYRRIFGRKVKVVATGGSPTPDRVLAFMREIFEGARVINSYGTTECPGIASDGVLNPGVEFKLVDAPEVGYTTGDRPRPRGEIVVRSPGMATAYWGKRESARAATAANFRDGWYYTGDIGEFDPATKTLKIIDRRANLAELYVDGRSAWIPIEPVEDTYRSSPLVENLYLHSDRDQPCLIAVAVPAGGATEDAILGELRRIAKENDFDYLRVPKAVILAKGKWSAATGELSVTGKLVRGVLKKKYENELAAKYAALERQSQNDPQFDWGTYRFTAASEADASRLNAQYADLWALTIRYRTALQEFSRRMRELEGAKQAEILRLREARPALLQGDRAAAREKIAQLKADFSRLDAELMALKSQTDPGVDAAREVWRDGISEFVAACRACKVDVPWQISSGTFLLPPSTGDTNALPPQAGQPNWRVVCAGCGDEIEWGAVGLGTPRWKDIDSYTRAFCVDCFPVLKDTLTDGVFVEETMHPIWIHDEALVKARITPKSFAVTLAVFVDASLEAYAGRPCILEGGRWLSFAEVAAIARPVGAAAQQFRSVGFVGAVNAWIVVAAIGVLQAGVAVLPADEAEFVFAAGAVERPHAIASEAGLREFGAGRIAVEPPTAPANTAILGLINTRYSANVALQAVGAVEASPEVIGVILHGTINCGGRLVFTGQSVVEALAKVRPTMVLLSSADAQPLRRVEEMAAIGGRVRLALVLGQVAPDLADHLTTLFNQRVRFSIESLPSSEID